MLENARGKNGKKVWFDGAEELGKLMIKVLKMMDLDIWTQNREGDQEKEESKSKMAQVRRRGSWEGE